MVTVKEVEEIFKEIFQEEDGKVSSVDVVYEMSKNEKFYKLVISIHGISIEETLIILNHNKNNVKLTDAKLYEIYKQTIHG